VLLSLVAGVWVGTNEIHPTHPATRVGFIFIRFEKTGWVGRTSDYRN
jgi:hypothetical protein